MNGSSPEGPQPSGTSRRAFGPQPGTKLVVVASALALAMFAGVRLNRRTAEHALSSSRDQLDAILQGVADAITVQDPDGRIVYANDAAAHLVGHTTAAE